MGEKRGVVKGVQEVLVGVVNAELEGAGFEETDKVEVLLVASREELVLEEQVDGGPMFGIVAETLVNEMDCLDGDITAHRVAVHSTPIRGLENRNGLGIEGGLSHEQSIHQTS